MIENSWPLAIDICDRPSNLPGFGIENKGQIAITQRLVSNSNYLSTTIN
jgi:hypothetical protein